MTLRFAPLVATLLLAFSQLNAAESPMPRLTAQTTRLTADEYIATGEARLAHKDVVLYADEIVYRTTDRIAIARGNVVLIRGAQRLVADELTYHYEDQAYTVGRFRVGQNGLLAEGARAEGVPGTLHVEQATLTYGEPDPLSPSLRARTVTYQDAADKKAASVKLEGGRLGIGSTNVIPLPTVRETPGAPTISDVHVKASYGGTLGGELSLSSATPVEENLHLGGDFGIFTKRGVLFGPIGDYGSFDGDGVGARGKFKTGYIKDQGSPGIDIRDKPIGSDRDFIDWQHYQVLQPGTTLSAQLHSWSDSYVTRDFRPEEFNSIQTPDTWFEAAKAGDNYVVSLFSRVQVNNYSLVQERLPELRFDGLPVELGGGVYHRINAGVAVLKQDDPLTGLSTHSNRADLYYGVNRPFSPREWFSITPVAGTRITHYARPSGPDGDYTRILGEAGFDGKLWENSATWDYKNKCWGIDGLRHTATPRIGYRLSPSADVGTKGANPSIPAIDDDVFNTYLRPLGIADRRNIDRLPAVNTFRFGLDNTLQTRDNTHGSRDLARVNVAIDEYADANAAHEAVAGPNAPAGSRSRSDAHTFAELTPVRWLRYDLYDRTTVQTGDMRELNTGLTVHDANAWKFRLGTHYLDDPIAPGKIQEYTANYGLRLNEIYSIELGVRYDVVTGQFTEQSCAVHQRLSRTWTVSYEVALHDGPRRESSASVGVRIEAEGF